MRKDGEIHWRDLTKLTRGDVFKETFLPIPWLTPWSG